VAVGGRVEVDDAAILELLSSPAGPVGRYMVEGAQAVTQGAKKRAPVGDNSRTPQGHPSGFLRSQLAWELTSANPITVEIETTAHTSSANPFPGEFYALHIEDPGTRPRKPPPFARDDQPYLVPALLEDWPQ